MASPLLNVNLQTGMLQYSKRKSFIGPGVNYNEIEFILLDCFCTNFNSGNFSPSSLQNDIQNAYSEMYQNNIYCKTFQIPGNYNDPKNDGVRTARFQTQIENRLNSSFSNQTEFGNANFDGVSSTFFQEYGPNFNSFSENYEYSKGTDGTETVEHSLNFSILAGNSSNAKAIANFVFSADSSNAFYTSLTQQLITPALLNFQQNVRQYYTETYDELKNVYSFVKHIDYPPLLSENSLNVNKNVKNSITLGEDGITTVSEEGKIKAFTDFNQAVLEYNDSVTNSIYNRCNAFYNSFSSLANISNGVLNNYPIKNDAIYNKPGLTVDYTVSFTDNPNFNLTYDTITQKTVKIDLIEDKYINIEHSYDFTRLAHVSLAQTGVMIQAIQAADTESALVIPNIYASSEIYNPYLTSIPRIKESFTLPNRKRNFSANFMYSNEPVFFIDIGGTIYPKLHYTISDDTPDSIIQEYKAINRPSQTSVLSYAYQDTVGNKEIKIDGILTRNYGQTFISPQNIQQQFIPLFNWGVSTLMSSFDNSNILAFTYYLDDVKIQFNSENEFTMVISIKYTLKKYSN